MSERILAIDCATPALSVALFADETCIAASHVELGRGHAEALLPAIAALPEGGRCERIIVDVGPGSFTGVRVGIAAATALGFAWQVPVTGFGCLDLVAAMARHRLGLTDTFAVVMVGGHGELFWANASGNGDSPLAVRSTPIDELARTLDLALLVGSGAETLVRAGAVGKAVPMLPDVRELLLLPPALRAQPAKPVYGRGADARPMAAPTRTPTPATTPR